MGMDHPFISMVTDFGLSEYVAAMKVAILREYPEALVIDFYHDVLHGAILQGAHLLVKAVREMPDAVHLVVVDPGVGTDRRAVIVRTDGLTLVGPDNGVLEPVTRGTNDLVIREIAFPPGGASPVFHGRDLFAPTAARIARGDDLDTLGRTVGSLMALPSYGFDRFGDRFITRVVHVDVFGNVQTPIPYRSMEDLVDTKRNVLVWIADESYEARIVSTYGDLALGELGVLVSSSGHMEVAQRDGPAAVLMGSRIGDEIAIDAE
jgi:S-adenosylmethionine hydrolase